MTRKKEAKELIEILLRQQRRSRPQRQDPLEGIEWEGLPPEFRDRVYRPPEAREPLVDLLASIEGKTSAGSAGAGLPSDDAAEPERAGGSVPARPGWRMRAAAWLFDAFAFLNRTYEVRAATVVAFGAGAAFFACLCYLVGSAGNRPSLTVYEHTGSAERLEIVKPGAQERPIVKGAVAGVPRPPAPGPAVTPSGTGGGAPPPPAKGYPIRITTANSRAGAERVCEYLSRGGCDAYEPRFHEADGGWVVLLGRWPTAADARNALEELRPTLLQMKSAGVISNSDFFVPPATTR